MSISQAGLRRALDAFATALPNIIIMLIVLSLPLTAAQQLGLSEQKTSSWIFALYALPSVLSLIIALWTRQPLLLTGNLFVIIFITSLSSELSFPELVGASSLAGLGVLAMSLLGLSGWLAAWIPAPIVYGLLSGAVISFVTDMFKSLGQDPLLVGGTLLAYLIGRRVFGKKLPAILPAFLVGHLIAGFTGDLGPLPEELSLYLPQLTLPDFSLNAIITATPVIVIFITLQANIPSIIFLRNQGYDIANQLINGISGISVALGSLIGPTGVSLSLPITSLVGGPQAGEKEYRYRAVLIVAGAALFTGIFSAIAAEIPDMVPRSLLISLAGLAVLEVLASALQRVTEGPLRWGPLLAFVVALSDISLGGFGRYFWALVLGITATYLLEGEELHGMWDPPGESGPVGE